MVWVETVKTFAKKLVEDNRAIGMAMIAGIVMIIVGGIVYVLGVYLISAVDQSIPLIWAPGWTSANASALNSTQAQARVNISNAFNIVGIGLVVGGIIAILYEVMPIAGMFMGGRRM